MSLLAIPTLQAKLPVTFMPSDELADAAKRLQATSASTDSQAAEQQQQSNRAARDGMSEEELKVYERLVRGMRLCLHSWCRYRISINTILTQ